MKIYRIRDKFTGLYLSECHLRTPYLRPSTFNEVGIFWKKIDTVDRHLRELCTTYLWRHPDGTVRGFEAGQQKPTWEVKVEPVEFLRDRLERFEVVAHDITIHGESVLQAKDLVKEDA